MRKVCLIVLDGWGSSRKKKGNAVLAARTPNMDKLSKEYPRTTIATSGLAVGLPDGQMGNSEVGHLTLGAGRVIYQELTRINKAIENGEFAANPVLSTLFDKIKDTGGALHLMGLLSDGGVHSHIEHLYAAIDAAAKAGISDVFVHAFLDGRDTPPSSGLGYVKALRGYMEKKGKGRVATIMGRYFAMDRDNRWDRVEKAYAAMTNSAGLVAPDPVEAVEEAYRRGETDEFVTPTIIAGAREVSDGDGVLFFNFRADRAREITRAFVEKSFKGFKRKKRPKLAGFASMTRYDQGFGTPVLFAPQGLENILGEVLSRDGVKQFRVSETEKYAHVTFFFNGGRESPFEGEERLLIPSVKDVPTYDKKPEMRAPEIADAVVEKIGKGGYSFILINFANGDMVGHTGIMDAAVAGCEAVDKAVGRVVKAARKDGWAVILTSDHGNAEQMVEPDGGAMTAHTTNPVPFILVDDERKKKRLKSGGGLKDVAPTILRIMEIDQPAAMEGTPLV